ncbi:hypothetical protein ACQKLN_00810 [Paenibacillus glucanolyticus]|nr:hypothetical protein [Paenibacillus vortex]
MLCLLLWTDGIAAPALQMDSDGESLSVILFNITHGYLGYGRYPVLCGPVGFFE